MGWKIVIDSERCPDHTIYYALGDDGHYTKHEIMRPECHGTCSKETCPLRAEEEE